eukprot:Opistho-2@27587
MPRSVVKYYQTVLLLGVLAAFAMVVFQYTEPLRNGLCGAIASQRLDVNALLAEQQSRSPTVRADLGIVMHEMYNSLQLVKNDVVLCMTASADKIDVLVRVVAEWDGPAVVAIYSRDEDMAKRTLASIGQLVRDGENTAFIHVQAVARDTFYPVNAMRNFAISAVPVDRGYSVFVLDADMMPSKGAYHELLRLNAVTQNAWKALVIPCFEFGNNSYDMAADVNMIPRTKKQLLATTRANMTRQSKLTYYPRGHSCTEYERWLYGTDSKPWLQSTYHWQYEPFFVVRRTSHFPLFDDGYVFWGGNKQSHTWLMFAMGYRFWTVPKVFSVHYPHPSLTPPTRATNTTNPADTEQLAKNRRRWQVGRVEISKKYGVALEDYDFQRIGVPPPFKPGKQPAS